MLRQLFLRPKFKPFHHDNVSPVQTTTVRNLSFFSDIFGYSPSKIKEKIQPRKPTSTPVKQIEKKDVITPSSQSKAEATRPESIEVPLEKERIRGSYYPARGVRNPPRRLREWRHTVENLTLGPRKLNLVARLIRKLPVEEARSQLIFSKKAISREVLVALNEACKIAREDANLHPKELIVGQCYVGGKIIGKKVDIKGRGKSGTILKRVSHLNIVLYEHPSLVSGFFSDKFAHLLPERADQIPRRRIPSYVARGIQSLERRGGARRTPEKWQAIERARANSIKNDASLKGSKKQAQ